MENVKFKIENVELRVKSYGLADYELQITDYALASRLPLAVQIE